MGSSGSRIVAWRVPARREVAEAGDEGRMAAGEGSGTTHGVSLAIHLSTVEVKGPAPSDPVMLNELVSRREWSAELKFFPPTVTYSTTPTTAAAAVGKRRKQAQRGVGWHVSAGAVYITSTNTLAS